MTWWMKAEELALYRASRACSEASMASTAQFWRAVRRGTLSDLRGGACSDCGRKCTTHDHRDYAKWWEVAAVCRACNVKRGRAAPFLHLPFRWDRNKDEPLRHAPFVNQFALSMLEATTEPLDVCL